MPSFPGFRFEEGAPLEGQPYPKADGERTQPQTEANGALSWGVYRREQPVADIIEPQERVVRPTLRQSGGDRLAHRYLAHHHEERRSHKQRRLQRTAGESDIR